MAAEAEMQEQFFDRAKAVFAAVMRDGTVAAMGREAIKDVRNTLHETYFGRGEHAGEPGAPLNPTQGEIAAARQEDPQLYGPKQEASQPTPSPRDIAHDKDQGVAHGPRQKDGQEQRAEAAQDGKDRPSASPGDIANDRDKGGVQGPQEKPGWADRIADERKGTQGSEDQNERAEGRLKANEELEKRREEERDRGGRDGR